MGKYRSQLGFVAHILRQNREIVDHHRAVKKCTFSPRLCYCAQSRPPTYLRVYNRRNSRRQRLHGSPMAINGGCRSILPEVQIGQICGILTDPRPLEVNAWV